MKLVKIIDPVFIAGVAYEVGQIVECQDEDFGTVVGMGRAVEASATDLEDSKKKAK